MLNQAALKELLTKMVGPAAKRDAVAYLRNVLQMSARPSIAELVKSCELQVSKW